MLITRIFTCMTLTCSLLIASASLAATPPADNQIKSAQADIARFEQQASEFSAASSKSSIRRMLKLMKITRQRLEGSANKSHPSWREADQQFIALQARLQAFIDGDRAPQPASAGSSRPATPPAAIKAASGKQLVSGQRVQVKKLARDINNARQTIDNTGPSPMQDGRVVARYNKALKKYANALSRYKGFAPDPDIGAAVAEYKAFVADIKSEFARSRQQLAQVGDAQARLAAVETNLRAKQPPGQLLMPFTLAQAKTWVAQLSESKAAAQAARQEVNVLLPIAYLPADAKYSPKRANSLLRWTENAVQKGKQAVSATNGQLKHSFAFADKHELPFFRKLDPANKQHKANMFLQEGAEAGVYERLDKQKELAMSYAAFYQAFGKQPIPAIVARIDEIKQLRQRYANNRVKALGDSRLPKAVSTDAQRLAIAKQILANPEYEFAPHGPVVLTTDKIVTREKEVSRETIKEFDLSLSGTLTLSGTRETWQYKWDEFKFATALKHEDGQWYVWWLTAKKYASGWEKTPIGKWVSGRATQGSLILEKNL